MTHFHQYWSALLAPRLDSSLIWFAADLNSFILREHALIPHERYDVVVVARVHMLQRERATLLRVSTWLRPDGVIIITDGKPAGSTDNRSLIWGK
jgi:hypothetical protein